MKKEDFDKTFDNIDPEFVSELSDENTEDTNTEDKKTNVPSGASRFMRPFKIAASVATVAAFVAAGVMLFRTPNALPQENSAPDQPHSSEPASEPQEESKTESYTGVTELSEEPAYSCPEEESEIEYYDPSLQSSADGEVIFEEPPENGRYSFAAPEFLYAALKGFDEMGSLRNDPDFERFGDLYISFLDEFTKEIPADLMYPYLNGSPMKISGVAEWQQITLFTCELYNLPWIWYYCEYDGKCVVVGVSYLDYLNQFGVAQTEDVIEFISSVAPHSPLPANREQCVNSSGLTDIFETELVLADGVRVNALALEYANGRTYYRFIQNRCILSVWYYDGGKPDDGFWNAFGIMPLE